MLCKNTKEVKVLHMSKDFTALKNMSGERTSKNILIPLQESLTANLPPLSASENAHQPFPLDPPSFECRHSCYSSLFTSETNDFAQRSSTKSK